MSEHTSSEAHCEDDVQLGPGGVPQSQPERAARRKNEDATAKRAKRQDMPTTIPERSRRRSDRRLPDAIDSGRVLGRVHSAGEAETGIGSAGGGGRGEKSRRFVAPMKCSRPTRFSS
jgi:hypothetical protein